MTGGDQAESSGAPAGVLIADDYPPNRTALRALLAPVAAITDVDSGERAPQEISHRDYAVVVLVTLPHPRLSAAAATGRP